MKWNVGRKLSLLFVLGLTLSSCGFIRENIFNSQPSISFITPSTTFYTPLASATYTWVTLDGLGQIAIPTKPYEITLYQGANCTGTVLDSVGQLTSSYLVSSMTSGQDYSIRVSVEYGGDGNVVTGCSPRIRMDNQNPNTVVFTAPAGSPTYRNLNNYTFTWTAPADPGGSGIAYYIYSGYSTNNCSGGIITGPANTAGLSFLWSGLVTSTSYSIEVTAVDNAGNVGATLCTSPQFVYVDLVVPVVGCTNMTPGWYITSSMPLTLNNSCADVGGSGCNAGGLQCRYSADNGTSWGAWGSCTQSWADSTTGAGSKFQVRQTDMATNSGSSGSCNIQVDKIAPPAPTITSSPPAVTSTTSWNFTYNSVDTVSGTASYDCQIDGGGWIIGCGASYLTGVLAAGAHTFDVRALDTAGNTSSTSSHSWTIDTTAPVCTVAQFGIFDGAVTYWTNNTNPTVSFTCTDDSGSVSAGTFECSIDGGAWGVCSGISYIYPNGTFDMGVALPDGAHTVAVRVQDASANLGTSADMLYSIDTVLPTFTCNGQTAVAWKNSATPVQLYGTCSDADSGCSAGTLQCSFDGGTLWISCTEAVAAIPEGNPVTYIVGASDIAGNSSTLGTCQYKLDRTDPTVSGVVASACGGSATNPILSGFNYDITPTASDALSGLSTLTCDGSACTTGVPYTIVGGSLATVTDIVIAATDSAGNTTNYNQPVYIAGSGLTSTAVTPNGGYFTNNPVLTTTLSVTDGNANNWAVGTSLVVNTDSVCGGTTPWPADQWTVGANTAKQKTTGNYALDGLRQTKSQLADGCGNTTAWSAYSATTDLDWSNPQTTTCTAVCDGAGDITVTFVTTEPVASCSAGDESGVAGAYLELNGITTSPIQPASGVYIFNTFPSSGAHNVICYAVDNAGNDNRVNDTNLTGAQSGSTPVNCP